MEERSVSERGRPAGRCSPFALIFLAAALYVFISGYRLIAPILLAFLLVLLLALALNPLVVLLRRWMGGRTLATLMVLIAFLTLAGIGGWAFYRPIRQSAAQFVQRLPEYWERIQRPLVKLEQRAAVSEQKLEHEVRREIKTEAENRDAPAPPPPPPAQTSERQGFMREAMSGLLGGAASGFKTVAANAATAVVIAITVLVGVVFTLLNPRPIIGFFFAMVPERHHDKTLVIAQRIIAMVPRWALATLLGMSTIGLLVFVAMWMILGFEDALVLGLIAFLFEAIPYIGPILAVVPAFLLAVGHGGLTPLWVLLAYASIQAIENNLVAPVIVGGRLRLHPVAVLFGIFVCVAAFGVLGVIVAVPLVVIAGILYEELYRPRFLPNTSASRIESLARSALTGRTTSTPQQKRRHRERRLRDGSEAAKSNPAGRSDSSEGAG